MSNRRSAGAFDCVALLLLVFAGACERERSRPSRAAENSTTTAAAPVTETRASTSPGDVPFDLGRVMRQVHFAFREDVGHWRGGDANYAVDVDGVRFSVTPRAGEGSAHREGPAITFSTRNVTRDGAELATPTAIASALEADGHLELHRGAVVEALRNGDEGVEQSWRFDARPTGRGDLEVRIDVEGAPFTSETRSGLHFADARNPLGLRYGHATWVDANGARVEVRARWDRDAIVLRVPASVVESSAYPCVLDPTIGPEFGTDAPVPVGNVWEQTMPAIATGGGQWLVVWEDSRSLVPGIFGARVNSAGTVLDRNGLSIATASGTRLYGPSVAFNGTSWLVAWESDQTSPPLEKNIYGARVSTAGVVLDATPIGLATGTYDQQLPAVASDGSGWIVVWQDHLSGSGTSSSFDIWGVIVNGAGTITATMNVDSGYADQTRPAVAYNGTDYLVAWADQRAGNAVIYTTRVSRTGTVASPFGNPMPGTGTTQANPSVASNGSGWLVAWDEYHAASSQDVVGARIDATGALVDVSELVISNAASSQSDPAVAFDGTNYVVAYSDTRTDTFGDIYATRVSPAGTILDASGVAICTVTQLQRWPALDFNGTQALVVWADNRYANYRDVYGARITGAISVVDTVSFAISTSANPEYSPALAFNGTNYLLVWQDRRHDLDYDIYGVRVSRTGTVLDASGIPISTGANRQAYPDVTSDGSNWLVVWGDDRNPTSDVYGARVSASGAVLDPTGIQIAAAANGQNLPAVAFDGTNYFVVWNDGRGGSFTDIYGARVSTAGTVLDATGIPICTAADYQSGPDVAFNGTNYYVVWMDRRSTSRYDLYGSRVSPAGTVLDGTGVAISAGSGNKSSPSISWGGTQWLAVWYQDRAIGGPDIYGQRIASAGTLTGSAIAISATANDEYFPDVTYDGSNWIVVWQDRRGGTLGNLYSARVSPGGSLLDSAGVLLASTTTFIDAPVIASGVGNEMLVSYVRLDDAQGYVERVFGRTLVWGGDPGSLCGSGSECTSGICVDGVCCMTACGGGATNDCMACSVAMGAATNGTCGPVAAARVCRAAAAGGCDVPETCDGTALTCPTDAFASSTQTCRPSAGMCDVAETCTGSSAACPMDGFAPSTQTCRPSAGMCDVAEACTGSSAACPMDGFAPGTQTCRPSAGVCDVAEPCTGSSVACPTDGFAPSTQTCRPSAGMCDVAETCDGSTAACPMDAFAPSTQTCRPSAGMCDVTEACTGSSAACPMDGFAPSTQTCRASAGACDIAEACTGSSAACPMDALQPNGTACSDSLTCNGAETCSMGACVVGAAPDCDDTDVCTTDSCGEPGGCAHAPVAGCCHTAGDCSDGDSCTDDSCVANACVHMPMTSCGVDAGNEDVVDVVATSDADDDAAEDAVEAPDATDATVDVADDSPADTAEDVVVDAGTDVRDVTVADVVDVPAVDAGADVVISDAASTDAARDVRGDVTDEGGTMPRGCACRTSQTGRADGRAIALAALLGAAIVMTNRRRRQRVRQNDAR